MNKYNTGVNYLNIHNSMNIGVLSYYVDNIVNTML